MRSISWHRVPNRGERDSLRDALFAQVWARSWRRERKKVDAPRHFIVRRACPRRGGLDAVFRSGIVAPATSLGGGYPSHTPGARCAGRSKGPTRTPPDRGRTSTRTPRRRYVGDRPRGDRRDRNRHGHARGRSSTPGPVSVWLRQERRFTGDDLEPEARFRAHAHRCARPHRGDTASRHDVDPPRTRSTCEGLRPRSHPVLISPDRLTRAIRKATPVHREPPIRISIVREGGTIPCQPRTAEAGRACS